VTTQQFLTTAAAALTLCTPAWADNSTDVAPGDGWASQGGGTSGGSKATAARIYKVTSASQLKSALSQAGTDAKIVKIAGTIDMAAADNGGRFTNHDDQAARGTVTVPSNTTLIGIGSTAKLVNASLSIKQVSNVIVRNLTLIAPCDLAPVWDPNDGSTGNWNSAFDAITIYSATRIWIDHNKFTDAPRTDDKLAVENGKIKQCHDGAVDITHASDYITVSYNVFDQHDKNNLIGSSDSSTDEDGHLSVTFHHNRFNKVMERAPRVRYGKVHLYNNYFSGSKTDSPYRNIYSIGVGYKAQILSNNNVLDIAGAAACPDVVKNPGSSAKTGAIKDTGSLLNGGNLALSTNCSFATASWTIPYAYTADPASGVKSKVVSSAGVGHLTVN
jgi:pectate lyase